MIRSLAGMLIRNFNCVEKTSFYPGIVPNHFQFQAPQFVSRQNLHSKFNKYCFSTKGVYKKRNLSTKSQPNSNQQSSQKTSSKTNPKFTTSHNSKIQHKQKYSYPDQSQQANPKISDLNTQVKSFIQIHTKPIQTQSTNDEKPIQIPQKVTSQILSNLYRLILIKGDFLGLNVRQGLSHQNRVKIEGLLKAKDSGSEYLLKEKGREGTVIKWSLQQHQQICDVVYLSGMVGERRIQANIKTQFLQYLSNMPSVIKTPDNQLIPIQFVFSHPQTTQNPINHSSKTMPLPILISNLFPAHTILTNTDNFAYEIIKTIVQKRSANQMIDVMKALTRLLTVKQLRSLDSLLVQGILEKTEKEVGRASLRSQSQCFGVENDNEEKRVMQLDEVIKMSSILSQLSLNGRSIQKCQLIFSHFLHAQTNNYTQLLNELPKIISNNQSQNLHEIFTPNLKFDQIMKMYIAVGQLGAVDPDLQYLMEKLFIVKLRLTLIIEGLSGKQLDRLKGMRVKYGMSEKEVSILLSTLHKFKKGSEVILLKSPILQQQTLKPSNPTPYNNIWLSIYKFYTLGQRTIPEAFLFSLLSGLYRSFTPLMMNAVYDCKIRKKNTKIEVQKLSSELDQTLGTLVRKLYEADEDLGYLLELKIQKLIEFVIVGQMAMMVGVLANIKVLNQRKINPNTTNSQAQLKPNTNFYPLLIDKIIKQLQKSKQQSFSSSQSEQNPQIDDNKHNSSQFPQTKKQLRQKQQIYSLLQFYLIFTKAHVEVLMSNREKTGEAQRQMIEQAMVGVRDKLKRVKMNQEMVVLMSALVRNSRQLAEGITEFSGLQQQQSQIPQTIAQISLRLIAFIDSLQSFIGFGSLQPISEYTQQLHGGLLTRLFPHILDQEQLLKSLSSHLLCIKLGSSDDLICEKFVMNNMLLMEEMVRVKLIRDEAEFRQYENLAVDNSSGQGQEQ